MTKRILLALALAASVAGAIACTNPSSTTTPTTSVPSAAAPSTSLESPAESMSTESALPSSS